MTKTADIEKVDFQAEVKQVLDLVINSLYSNKEIFLRELISNASDAIDKARISSLTDVESLGDDKEFKIKIAFNPDRKTISVIDNGIGMNRQELIENIGTIARSGTKNFISSLSGEQKKDSNLIGQFGVGFYSAFMVSKKVELTTKKMGSDEPAIKWTSEGDGSYTLEADQKTSRGTEIILHLKDEDKEYADEWKVRSIIKKYSSYIAHPIAIDTKKDKKVEEEILNDKPPIWRRPKTEIKPEEYKDFYKHLSYDQEEPLAYAHTHAEGTLEYTTLMYIPSKAPYDMFYPEKNNGLNLYVKRVFIMNDCKELMPGYLRFVKGIVDSEDLPLNISREILQQNAVLNKIQKASTKKVLSMLENMANKKPEDYKTFWNQFGQVLKEGFHMNWENLDELKKLVRFNSSICKSEDELRSFDEYVKDMNKEQKDIYYITGPSRTAVNHSPHLEVFKEKNIEVIYFTDPIDEWVIQSLAEFDGKKLKSVTKGDLDLGKLSKEEKASQKEGQSKLKKLSQFLQDSFPEQLKEVRVTTRLKDSPCCLVADESDMGVNMERILKMAHQEVKASKRIMEINPSHPIITNIQSILEAEPDNSKLKEWGSLLFDQALLAEGSPISDPKNFVSRINDLLKEVSETAKR